MAGVDGAIVDAWVLATHREEDVPSCATHALVLDQGRVVYRGVIGRAPLAKWLDHRLARE